MTLLTLSASVLGLRQTCYRKDDCFATSQTAVFSLELYLVALGSSGMKPCVSSYWADQLDGVDEVHEYTSIKNLAAILSPDFASFLDKVAVEKESNHSKGLVNPWRLCTITQGEMLKWIIRMLPVLATRIIFNTVLGQMSNMFLLQAEYMDARLGRPNFRILVASFSIFNPISVIFWYPL
ncbi:UNVERIFIED_CONTAM: protein NRT1/ PTR FAMILY 8.2 [Sesamum latifolium]|uniref:Protein NRT1/ PTR FAMILY 8.2 n=1 Tax=Sesamum latifolium TaxID=2727402 RepID=A0AAW2X675_9LAMI